MAAAAAVEDYLESLAEPRRSEVQRSPWSRCGSRWRANLERVAPVAQPAEAGDLKSLQCEFESHRGYGTDLSSVESAGVERDLDVDSLRSWW